jgi:hypothetical protein
VVLRDKMVESKAETTHLNEEGIESQILQFLNKEGKIEDSILYA